MISRCSPPFEKLQRPARRPRTVFHGGHERFCRYMVRAGSRHEDASRNEKPCRPRINFLVSLERRSDRFLVPAERRWIEYENVKSLAGVIELGEPCENVRLLKLDIRDFIDRRVHLRVRDGKIRTVDSMNPRRAPA